MGITADVKEDMMLMPLERKWQLVITSKEHKITKTVEEVKIFPFLEI